MKQMSNGILRASFPVILCQVELNPFERGKRSILHPLRSEGRDLSLMR